MELQGAETLQGEGGADYLVGRGGWDEVYGGAGNDTIEGNGAADAGDLPDGGDGRDEFSFDGDRKNVTIDLAAGTTFSGARLLDIEDAWGDTGDDLDPRRRGGQPAPGLDRQRHAGGSAGADTLDGQGGDDSLGGGGGADFLIGGASQDTARGGAGDGTFRSESAADNGDLLDGGGGLDVAGFSGNQADHAVMLHRDASGAVTHVTVADTVADRDSTDMILLGADGATVERLRSADGGADVICFMPGTPVAAPAGEVPVETLRRGDLVLTAEGRTVLIHPGHGARGRTAAARPAGFARPRAALGRRPGPRGRAGDGAAIRRETDVPERWPYRHVELADHGLVLAEGVAAKTFVDNAGRLAFGSWAEHGAPHPEGRAVEQMALPRAKSRR